MQVEVNSPIEQAWKPHKKQQEFIRLPFDVAEALYGGAAGGGKSEVLVMLPLIYRFHEHPKFKGIILRRTNPELDAEIIGRAREWYPNTGAVWNEGKKKYVWYDKWGNPGAEMRFGHAELEKDIRKYDGVQYNYVAFDEATSFTSFQYLYLILTRRRSATTDLPAIGRSATNPGNVGHLFQRGRFVDPYPMGGKILIDSVSGIRRFFLQCLGTENPHLLKANPRYFEDMKSFGLQSAEYRAKALGDWYTFSGQVFTEFRVEPLDNEPPNARHVIAPFDIPSWWPRVIAIDWGFAAYTVIGWGAISPDGRVYVYRVYAAKGQYINNWVGELINRTGNEWDSVRDIVICHSANQNRGEPHTILQQVQTAIDDYLGVAGSISVRLGKRDRLGGKLLLHEYLRWIPKPTQPVPIEQFDQELADRILRQYGTNKYHEYLNFFKPQEPETNLPKLQIFESSPEGTSNEILYDTIPLCMYDDKGEKDKTPEDVKEFDGDDPYDMLRMLLESVDRYVVESAHEHTKLAERDAILNQLQQTGNQTVFYQRMAAHEAHHAKSFGVRRGGRRRR